MGPNFGAVEGHVDRQVAEHLDAPRVRRLPQRLPLTVGHHLQEALEAHVVGLLVVHGG